MSSIMDLSPVRQVQTVMVKVQEEKLKEEEEKFNYRRNREKYIRT